jgi:integral membrane sensor domain MASE1
MTIVSPTRTLRRSIVAALVLAAAYTALGRLGLWLATPPGYATPLWPSSGLALAGLLTGDARVWPGIWLGSFLVNIGTAFDASHAAALLASVAIPTTIGVGATVQALVGAGLVRRCVGVPSALTQAGEIGVFLALGGPVSCLISATVGVTTLVVSGQIPWALVAITWGTWWIGDTLGVLIVTPLVLSWLAEPPTDLAAPAGVGGLAACQCVGPCHRRFHAYARAGTGAPASRLRAAGGELGPKLPQ